MTDKEAFLEFARGAFVPTLILVVFFAIILSIDEPDNEPREKFKVVDQYGPCEVVRYTDETNRWHYFLDCK